MTVRESQARLLADSRSSEPRARLAQAVTRAEFLLRASRTLSTVQNPIRALESLTALLLEELVDIAQVVVRTGAWQLHAEAVHGGESTSGSYRWVDGGPSAFEDLLLRPQAEQIVLPESSEARRALLSTLLVDEQMIASVDQRGTEQLLVIPLSARGRAFGLMVLGRSPGYGFGDAVSFLEDLGERVAIGIDASLMVAESRYVASVLRRSLAPAELPEIPGISLAAHYRVAHQAEDVGGDFFDVHGDEDELLVVCGDVAGKGVEAAVHAKRIRNAVRTGAHVDRSPGWMLELVNKVLVTEAEPLSEQLSTAVCLRLRPDGDRVRVDVASAGHPPALLIRADGRLEEIQSGGLALGLLEDSTYDEVTVHLDARDTLVLYTDGVTEARGQEDFYGERRLQTLLRRLGGVPAAAVVESVAVAVSEHLGDRNHDDIAVLGVQFRPDQR